jgi:hypothetical protein
VDLASAQTVALEDSVLKDRSRLPSGTIRAQILDIVVFAASMIAFVIVLHD